MSLTTKDFYEKNAAYPLLPLALLFSANDAFAQSSSKRIAYRKGTLYGSLAKYQFNIDGKPYGKLKNNKFITANISAGEHTVAPKQKGRAVTYTAEAGKTYVAMYKTRLGILGGRPKIKIMSLEEAKKDKKFAKYYAKADPGML